MASKQCSGDARRAASLPDARDAGAAARACAPRRSLQRSVPLCELQDVLTRALLGIRHTFGALSVVTVVDGDGVVVDVGVGRPLPSHRIPPAGVAHSCVPPVLVWFSERRDGSARGRRCENWEYLAVGTKMPEATPTEAASPTRRAAGGGVAATEGADGVMAGPACVVGGGGVLLLVARKKRDSGREKNVGTCVCAEMGLSAADGRPGVYVASQQAAAKHNGTSDSRKVPHFTTNDAHRRLTSRF